MLRSLPLEKHAALSLNAHILRPASAAGLVFLLSRAELLLETSPLAAACISAMLARNVHPALPVAGCLLGMLRFPLSEIPLMNAAVCALLLLFDLLASLLPGMKRRIGDETRMSFFAGMACMLPAMIRAGGDATLSLQAFACGALAAAGAPFIFAALSLDANRKRFTPAEKCGCALAICGCIAGLERLCTPIAQGSAALTVLMLPGCSPASGVLAGLGLVMGGAGSGKIASLALCALVCMGNLFPLRWQRSLAFCAAAIAAQLVIGPDALDIRWVLGAAAVVPLLPGALAEHLQEVSSPPKEKICDPARVAREATAETRHKLNALADAFSVMAEGAPCALDVPDEQELIQQMRARLCSGCINYGACWAGENNQAVHLLCRLIGDALDRTDAPPGMRMLFSDGDIPPDILRICRRGRMIPDRLGFLLRDFAQKRQSEIKRCENNNILNLQLMQAGEILRALAGQRTMESCPPKMHAALEGAGLGFCEALPLQRGSYVLLKDEPWNREEVRRACTAICRSLGARFLPRPEGAALRMVRAPRLSAQACASCQSGVAGEICGDSHIVRMLDENHLLLAISDGMGSGEAASAESTEALRLLWSFLDAGISRQLSLETVNRQLLMGSSEELFATIDLCIIDLSSGVAEMTKLAACRTILLRGGEEMRIDGGHLPLGILENVQAGVSRVRLRPGDVLVMGSDGVMETGDALMAERLARENAALPPDQLAEMLVRQAMISRDDRHRDDLTCICVRIEAV